MASHPKIAEGQSVFHAGRTYVRGQEDALAEAKLDAASMKRLTDLGVFEGSAGAGTAAVADDDEPEPKPKRK